jgi:hypothetical protein
LYTCIDLDNHNRRRGHGRHCVMYAPHSFHSIKYRRIQYHTLEHNTIHNGRGTEIPPGPTLQAIWLMGVQAFSFDTVLIVYYSYHFHPIQRAVSKSAWQQYMRESTAQPLGIYPFAWQQYVPIYSSGRRGQGLNARPPSYHLCSERLVIGRGEGPATNPHMPHRHHLLFPSPLTFPPTGPSQPALPRGPSSPPRSER